MNEATKQTTRTHEVKSWPEFFAEIEAGRRTFDLRKNDRHYQEGDLIVLCEFDDRLGKRTGRKMTRRITSVLAGIGPGGITPLHGLSVGYCILALKDEGAA